MSLDTAAAPAGKAYAAYMQLKQEIESGMLAPGETLPESELVARTGASRTPVREAVRRLAAEGLIILEPRRAPMVSRISIAGARALFEFRRLVEPPAAAAVARVIANGSDKRGAEFRSLCERFERLAERGTAADFEDEFVELTSLFDTLLIAHTPNEHLARSIAELRPHTRRLRSIAHGDLARLPEAIREHVEMSDALASGDDQRASVAVMQHLFHVERSIFKRMWEAEAGALGSMELA